MVVFENLYTKTHKHALFPSIEYSGLCFDDDDENSEC